MSPDGISTLQHSLLDAGQAEHRSTTIVFSDGKQIVR
jgi:hypothetical protein